MIDSPQTLTFLRTAGEGRGLFAGTYLRCLPSIFNATHVILHCYSMRLIHFGELAFIEL